MEQRTKELLGTKSDLDDLKERSKHNLDEEMSKVQKLQSALKTAQDKLSGKEGQTSDLAEELSTLQCHYNEQLEANNDLKSQLLEKSNCLEDALRHKTDRYYI